MIYGEDLLGEVIRAWKVAVTDLTQGKWYEFSGGCILHPPAMVGNPSEFVFSAAFTRVINEKRCIIASNIYFLSCEKALQDRVRLVEFMTKRMDALFTMLDKSVKEFDAEPISPPSPEGSGEESKVPKGTAPTRGKRSKGG